MFVGLSMSHLEDDFRLSSKCTDEELRYQVGHHFNYVHPLVVHILFFSLCFSLFLIKLQNKFLEEELNKKEQALKFHKAEFDLRCKSSFYYIIILNYVNYIQLT